MLIEYRSISLLIIVFIFSTALLRAQTERHDNRPASEDAAPVVLLAEATAPAADEASAEHVLENIRKAVAGNNPRGLQRYFASKVYISLLTGKEGYFSAEQSYFIIKSFFLTYTPVAFSYSNSTPGTDTPYGVGTLQYVSRGKPGKAQLFVSLSKSDNNWRISQITITDR